MMRHFLFSRSLPVCFLALAGISISPAQTNLGPLAVGSSKTATVKVTIPAAATVTSVAVLTQGAPNLDFTDAGGGTCAAGAAYAANATCTVNVTFKPGYPGARYGAVVLQQSSGAAATAYLQGSGIGPQVAFLPLQGGYAGVASGASGIAADAAGNLYVGGSTLGVVYKETLTAKGYVESMIASGFHNVTGVAVDGAGNVYFADLTLSQLFKETPSEHGYIQTVLPTDGIQGDLYGIAVDGGGNVYIADDWNSEIVKDIPSGDGYVQTVLIRNVAFSFGIAVDGDGDIFVTTLETGRATVTKETPSADGTFVQTTIGSGFAAPYGVAVDGLGDVFVLDTTGLYEEVASNGVYAQIQISSPGYQPFFPPGWVAVDENEDIFSVWSAWDGGTLMEIGQSNLPTANFGGSTIGIPGTVGPLSFGVTNIGNQPLKLSAVTYPQDFPEGPQVSDPLGFPVGEPITGLCAAGETIEAGSMCELSVDFLPITPLHGQPSLQLNENVTVTSNSLNGAATTQGIPCTGGESHPWTTMQLAVSSDPSPEDQPAVLKATIRGLVDFSVGAAQTPIIPTGTVSIYNLSSPYAPLATVPLDSKGAATYSLGVQPVGTNTYFATYSGDGNFPTANASAVSVSIVAAPGASVANAAAGTVEVGSNAATPVEVTFDQAEKLGNIAVVTQGAANLDFTDAGGGTCATGQPYAAKAKCTVNVAFTPRAAGPRYGAVVLSDTAGNVIGAGYLQGMGIGPQPTFAPGTSTALLGPDTYPQHVTTDASGNIYVADGDVYKLTLSNGKYTQSVAISGLYDASGVAVDGMGNVYASDIDYNPAVYKGTLSGTGITQSTIGYGFVSPIGVAVDGAGNVYVADLWNNSSEIPSTVYKETLSNGGYIQTSIDNGWVQPSSVAVDGSGNVYVTDESFTGGGPAGDGVPGVFKETLANGRYTRTSIGSGWSRPVAVAVDGSGNVYVVDTPNTSGQGILVKETLQANGSYIQSTVLSSLGYPQGVAVDSLGNLYYTDGTLYRLDYADPPSLSFAATAVGSTSTDSPKTVTVENNGNAPLAFTVPSTGSNPSISPNFTLASSGASACPLVHAGASAAGTLAPGASCLLPVSFAPAVAGHLEGSLTLSDNAPLAGAPFNATQSIALSGAATGSLPAPAVTWPTPSAITYGTALGAQQLNAKSQVAGTFVYSPSAGTVLGAGQHTLSATFTPASTGSYSTVTNMVTLAVNPAVLTVTAQSASRTYGAANPSLSAMIAGFVNGETAATAISGAPELLLTAGAKSDAGAYPITPSSGSLEARNYTFNFVPGTLTVAKALLTVVANSASVKYGKPLPALTFTASGFLNGETVASLGGKPAETTTAKEGSLPGAYPIAISRGTLASPNYNLAFHNGMLTITALGKTEAPIFTPAGKTYSSPLSVTITDSTPKAVIYYTLNGATPSTKSTRYTGAIKVAKTETIKAVAMAAGYSQSAVATAKYTVK